MNSKEFYDQIPIGICLVKRDRRRMEILYANHALTHMMKKPSLWQGKSEMVSPKDIIGQTLIEAWPSVEMEALVKKLKSPVPPKDFTLPVYDEDTLGKRWAKLNIQETEFEGDDVFVLWATDVSASKKAEAELKLAVEEADAAAEMKSNFLATMSHEIRTPMQSVYGLLELIGEEKPPPGVMSMVNLNPDYQKLMGIYPLEGKLPIPRDTGHVLMPG